MGNHTFNYLILGVAFVTVALVLSGCGHYQPPGEDLWMAVR